MRNLISSRDAAQCDLSIERPQSSASARKCYCRAASSTIKPECSASTSGDDQQARQSPSPPRKNRRKHEWPHFAPEAWPAISATHPADLYFAWPAAFSNGVSGDDMILSASARWLSALRCRREGITPGRRDTPPCRHSDMLSYCQPCFPASISAVNLFMLHCR